MTIKKDRDNTIKMYQGDTGRIRFKGFKTDKNYLISFVIYNSKRKIISEIKIYTEKQDYITVNITQDISNKLTVAPNLSYETYYYGIKKNNIDTKTEDTMTIGNSKFGEQNKFIVFALKAEGI